MDDQGGQIASTLRQQVLGLGNGLGAQVVGVSSASSDRSVISVGGSQRAARTNDAGQGRDQTGRVLHVDGISHLVANMSQCILVGAVLRQIVYGISKCTVADGCVLGGSSNCLRNQSTASTPSVVRLHHGGGRRNGVEERHLDTGASGVVQNTASSDSARFDKGALLENGLLQITCKRCASG